MNGIRLLLVEDDESLCRTLEAHLSDIGYTVSSAADGEAALGQIASFGPDIVITDVQMPGMSGFELLEVLRKRQPDVDVIVFTGYADVQGAIDAIKQGAYDYLVKPVDLDDIENVLERCVGDRAGRELRATANAAPDPPLPRGRMVGRHSAMMEVYKTIGAVSSSRAPVLVSGETGTGKELVARTIHENSPFAGEPFVAVNCAALPETLLESELFGHVRGAFTGAVADRRGRFELAGKGTVFLDEIGDTSLAFQAKLLRVLQEREFYAVGGEVPRSTEARVVAASHRPLRQLVQEGAFREDLFFRLQVIELHVPPLRERRSDIPLLVRHILAKAAVEISGPLPVVPYEVMMELIRRDWPGNVRELENVLTRGVVLCRGGTLSIDDVGGPSPADARPTEAATQQDRLASGTGEMSLDAIEKEHVRYTLLATDGNKSAAARLLKVSRPRLDRIIARHDLAS
jgi:DNA-binding NtrC family response regulator